MPFGRLFEEIILSGGHGAGLIVRKIPFLTVCAVEQLSVAVMLIFHVPEAEGVPVIIPVGVRVRPAGRMFPLSGVSDQMTGVDPPLENNC